MISILIPAYDEEEIIRQSATSVHRYLEARSTEHEILVIDNGSQDKTAEICRELEQSVDWFRFFQLEERGAGRAFVKGIREARGEYCISLDADLSSELSFLDYAIDLNSYYDMLVGSKTLGSQKRSFVRMLGSIAYIALTQWWFGLTVSDYSIGVKAYRKASILEALDYLDGWTGYAFELCLWLRLKGRRVLQIGVECNDTRRSHFNILHEAFFRYGHLFRTYRRLKDKKSWFNI